MIGKTNSEGSSVNLDGLSAIPSKVLSGQKFFGSGSEEIQTGTMPDKGAVNSSLNCGGTYTIPAGYHNGGGKVTANNLSSQTAANATAGQILTGQTAWVNGSKLTGSMANQGAKTSALNCGGSYTIPPGFHNGSGKITANSLSSQTSGTATAGQILSGKTAWVNGNKLTGSMASQGGSTTTPGTANKTIVSANRYVTGNIVVVGDANLVASNIRKGKTIFGVAGSAEVYDIDELMLLNGAMVNGIIEKFNYNIPGNMGSASVTMNSNGIEIKATNYSYKMGNRYDSYKQGTTFVTSNKPIKKSSYPKLRLEYTLYNITSKSGSASLRVELVSDYNSSSYIVFNEVRSNSYGMAVQGTMDVDISSISNTQELYIKLGMHSSGESYEGSGSAPRPANGSYVVFRKLYFTR